MVCVCVYSVYMCFSFLTCDGRDGDAHPEPGLDGSKLVVATICQGDRLDHELLGKGADEGGRRCRSVGGANHVWWW